MESMDHNVTVSFCLKHGAPTQAMNGTACTSRFSFTVHGDEALQWHIPFPAGGWWYMSMEAECYTDFE